MSGRGEVIVAITATFLSIAAVIVSLRCYAHTFLLPCFGLDDGLAIAALVCQSTLVDLPLESVVISSLTWIITAFPYSFFFVRDIECSKGWVGPRYYGLATSDD